nr:type VII secretion target [Mycobacterium sp.]
MGDLDVCGEGLQALAGQCSADASRLATEIPAGMAGPPAQATAAAVRSAYMAIVASAAALAARVQGTGDKLTVAATQYVSTDETSAQRLSSLGGGRAQV